MQIQKVTLNGKEVEVEINSSAQLSDTDLDKVQGGVVLPGTPEDTTVYQYVCTICGWKSNWCTDNTKYEASQLLAPHIAATSHNDFRCEEFCLPKG